MNIVMVIVFVVVSLVPVIPVSGKELSWDELSPEMQQELLKAQKNNRAVEKTETPRKNILELDTVPTPKPKVRASKMKDAEAAQIEKDIAQQKPVIKSGDENLKVLPKDEVAEKAFTEKVNAIISAAKPPEANKVPLGTKIKLQFIELQRLIVRSDVHVGLILGVSGFNTWNTDGQPTGFATESSDQTGMKYELGLQAKFKQFGVEWLPFDNHAVLATKFYGASLGNIRVTRTSVLIGKFYPIETPKYMVSVGLGTEHTKLDSNVMMGGFKFPTKGDGWSPVFQVGGQYHLNKRLSLEGDYVKRNVRVITEIPGVPDLVSSLESSYSFRLVWWPF